MCIVICTSVLVHEEGVDLFVIRSPKIKDEFHSVHYTYNFHSTNDLLSNFGDNTPAGPYVWDTKSMKVEENNYIVVTAFLYKRPLNFMKNSTAGKDDNVP